MAAKIKLGFAPTRRAIFSAPAAVEYRKLTADRLKKFCVNILQNTWMQCVRTVKLVLNAISGVY